MTGAEIFLITSELETDLVKRLYPDDTPGQQGLYLNLFKQPVFLRPGVELRGYISKKLYDRFAHGF